MSGTNAYSTWVELRVSCTNLKDADRFSAPDAVAILSQSVQKGEGTTWREVGRTEQVGNTYAPSFVRAFKVLYNFEYVQSYRLVVVDIDQGQDSATVPIEYCDQLGYAEFTLSELLTCRERQFTINLKQKNGQPTKSLVTLTVEEMSNANSLVHIGFCGTNLANMERLSKSDPFIEICRLQEDGQSWLPVFKTEVIPNNLDPTWRKISVSAVQMCNGDYNRSLKLRVFDYEVNGKHRLIGEVETTLELLSKVKADEGLPLRKGGDKEKDYGQLHVTYYAREPRPSFLDYIMAGFELKFMVAVDFTASNGEPALTQSLHYMAPNGNPTPYEEAIMGVGRVLEVYDLDKRFPVFGFGGRVGGNATSHCFALTGDEYLPEVQGVHGILFAYRTALSKVHLSGPTYFAQVIRRAAAAATKTKGSAYTCLLILTDGAIMDMQDTVSAIVDASALPLSIIIVGVGHDDFRSMSALDSDRSALIAPDGRVAERDIVQFVEFAKHSNDGAALAADLLAELPGQFLQYMRLHNIKVPTPGFSNFVPQPPPPVDGEATEMSYPTV